MNKLVIIGFVGLLLVSLFTSINVFQLRNSNSLGLSVSYTAVDEITTRCDLIVIANVTAEKELLRLDIDESTYVDGITQKIIVSEVLKNDTDNLLSPNSNIKIAVYDGYITKNNGSKLKLSDFSELEPGEYLLFLNELSMHDGVFVNNTPNNLYRRNLIDLGRNNNKKFYNVNGLSLITIEVQEVIDVINRLEKAEDKRY